MRLRPGFRPAAAHGFFCLLLAFAPSFAGAQSLEPRLYVPLPTGRNIAGLSYTHSRGDVILESSVPITDVRATIDAATLIYVRTFGLFGRSAQVQAVAPLVSGVARGAVVGRDSSRDLRGPADPILRIAVNLKGGPARQRSEMAGVRFGTIVGASLGLSPPLGDYDTNRRINLGANRWSFKPELGLLQPLGKRRVWVLETYAGVWLFGDNTAYLDTATVTQQSVWAFQGHLIRILGRRAWVALDGTLVQGGTTSVDGVVQSNFQEDVRLGTTAAYSLGGGHALKGSFSTGVYTRFGGDFDVISVGYQYGWGR